MSDESKDIYLDVASQIGDVVQDEPGGCRLDDEKQKKVVEILKNNFNKSNEQMGKILMDDVGMFNPNTGNTINVSLFIVPIVIMRGFKLITQSVYPNYDIKNEYIGYTDGGVFHKVKKASRIEKFLRRDDVAILFIILAIIFLVINYYFFWVAIPI